MVADPRLSARELALAVRARRGPDPSQKETVLVFDERITGTTEVFTASDLRYVISSGERMAIQVIADDASGTSPALDLRVQHSADEQTWVDKNDAAEVSGALATGGAATVLVGFDLGARPTHQAARLRLRLTGTSPQAYVRVWVTSRDGT